MLRDAPFSVAVHERCLLQYVVLSPRMAKKYATHRGKIHRHFSLAHTQVREVTRSDHSKYPMQRKKRAGSAVASSHRRILLQTRGPELGTGDENRVSKQLGTNDTLSALFRHD